MHQDSTPSGPAPTGLGTYYDHLGWWTTLARPFGYGGGAAQSTVHRLLSDPRAGGQPTATRVHDVILESLPALNSPRILDAGCGLGGTMMDLVVRLNGTAVGLTLSASQRERARRSIAVRGLDGRADVRLQSYDAPPEGPFDLIVAIESLAHSSDPSKSVAALAAVLAPGGVLAVVDDMPEAAAIGSADLAAFRAGWQAPVVLARAEYLATFVRQRLSLHTEIDLTAESNVRTLEEIARMEWLNRTLRSVVPSRWRVVLDSYYGGLALERLYRHGLMRYRLLMASSPR